MEGLGKCVDGNEVEFGADNVTSLMGCGCPSSRDGEANCVELLGDEEIDERC